MEIVIYVVIFALVFGFIGKALGEMGGRKKGDAGFLCGALLGPLGCVIAAVIPADKPEGPTPTDDTQRKIAELEAQLTSLKTGRTATPASDKSRRPSYQDDGDDGGIPTYKLD